MIQILPNPTHTILWHEKTWAFHQLVNWEHKNYRVSCLNLHEWHFPVLSFSWLSETLVSVMNSQSYSLLFGPYWHLWVSPATGTVPRERIRFYCYNHVFFFHFSFSGIRNDSSNDLLMAWEQTASGHPCIVFFNWVSSTVIHVYKSILYMIFVISPCLCPTTCVTLMPDPEEFFWTRKSRALSLALQNSAFHCFNKLSSLHCNI